MRTQVYVVESAPNYLRARDIVETRLSDKMGGCTTITGAQGVWYDDSGERVADDITIVESYYGYEGTGFPRSFINDIAERIKELQDQDAVMYTIDNEAFFV